MTNLVTTDSRLPLPHVEGHSLTLGMWRVLCESIFPTAKTPEAIILAMEYCKVRNLDVMKRPVNIVPMWSTIQNKYVETVWPGINCVQIDAARSNSWAGMDEPKWGPDVTHTFKGVKKDNVGATEITLTYPEWCSVTVYRIVQGQRYAFTEPVFWRECYARIGKTELPNDMWSKRVRGQFLKVAKAFSLRAAFPEDADYTSEEMEGRTLEEVESNNGMVVENKPKKELVFKNAAIRGEFIMQMHRDYEAAASEEELHFYYSQNKVKIEAMRASGNDYDVMGAEELDKRYSAAVIRISKEEATRELAEEQMAIASESFGEGFAAIKETKTRPPVPEIPGVKKGKFLFKGGPKEEEIPAWATEEVPR